MKKFEGRNLHIKILSVVVAVSLWFYVGYEENPLAENKAEIAVSYENLSGDYVLIDKVDTITVSLRGRESQQNEFDKNTIKATVDLKNARPGEDNYEIEIQNRSGLDIISVTPSIAEVAIDELKTITLKVEPQLNGNVDKGYLLKGVTAIPSSISVSGPSIYLDQLRAAKAQLEVKDLTASVKEVASVTLLNQENEVITQDFLKILTPTVELEVVVEEKDPTKVVPLRTTVVGEVAEGYMVEGTTCTPSSITISGKEDVLKRVSIIYTADINVDGLNQSMQNDVALKIPEGITVEGGIKRAKVTVHVAEKVMEETLTLPIEIKGATSGMVTFTPQNAEIKIKGTADAIARAKATIKASVDVSNLTAGKHTIEVQCELAGNAKVESIAPTTVEATISTFGI